MYRPMSDQTLTFDVKGHVSRQFREARIDTNSIELRDYPEESIVVVYVDQEDSDRAIALANEIDRTLSARGFRGFVTIKATATSRKPPSERGPVDGLDDPRVVELVNLLIA